MRIVRACSLTGFVLLVVCASVLTIVRVSAEVPAGLPRLHEGLVLTYTWYAAVTAGNGSYYEEDEHGDWINRGTGRTYSRSMQLGTSGSGWTEISIAGIEGDKVILESTSYANAGALGRNVPVLQGSTGALSDLTDPGDYWMDPAKLASLVGSSPHVGVSRVQWQTAEKVVDAIRIQVLHGTSYSDHVYDAKTGLCLHVASSSPGPPPKLAGPGDMGQGDTTLTRNDFVGFRDVAVPWAKEPVPDWLASIHSLHFRGSTISRGALPTVPNVLVIDLQTLARGRTWLELQATASQQWQGAPSNPPTTSALAFARSQFDSLWISPHALTQLRQGQTLDEDPLTKMRTVVSKVEPNSVLITSSNAAAETENQYDLHTGMLIYSSFYTVLSQQQRTYRLQGSN